MLYKIVFGLLYFLGALVASSFSEFIPVYMALKQQNINILENKLQDISSPYSDNYGKYLTQSEINDIIIPKKEHVNLVIDWIQKYDIKKLNNYGDNIKFYADKDIVRGMFDIKLVDNRQIYHIPNYLRDIVEFVEMNSHKIDRFSKINYKGKDHDVDDRYFGRESLIRLYNLKNQSLNSTLSAGLIEYQNNGGFSDTDLNIQQSQNNQLNKSVMKVVGPNIGNDTESELDVQLLSETADNIDIWFWDTPYWLYSFSVDFYNSKDIPDVISMSWGWAEDSQCSIIDCVNITSQDYVRRVNNEYLKIVLRGVTVTVSSGDAGAPGRTSENCQSERPINPVFPGSSPYILSVGATYVVSEQKNYTFKSPLCKNDSCVEGIRENSISYDKVGWTAGGGFNMYTNKTPDWQRKEVETYLYSNVSLPNYKNFNILGRAYPDVSAVGHSCPVYLNSYLSGVDGTSCSSPIMAGLIAIINNHQWSRNRSSVGFINPLLYDIYRNCPNCFNDVTHGYNWCTEFECCDNYTQYGFIATKGYDPVTGLGTLNIDNILNYLDNFFTQ